MIILNKCELGINSKIISVSGSSERTPNYIDRNYSALLLASRSAFIFARVFLSRL